MEARQWQRQAEVEMRAVGYFRVSDEDQVEGYSLDACQVFSQNNVTYASITQDIDNSTPEGRLFMTMLGALAQYCSDAPSRHIKKGMRERAMQGLFNGEPPFGYERCDARCYGMDEGHTGCHVD